MLQAENVHCTFYEVHRRTRSIPWTHSTVISKRCASSGLNNITEQLHSCSRPMVFYANVTEWIRALSQTAQLFDQSYFATYLRRETPSVK